MRWFKHFTDAHIDSKLVSLRDEYGLEAYGLYWIILEAVAMEFKADGEPLVELLPKSWAKASGISSRKFRKLTQVMAESGLLKFKDCEKYWRIEVPKLLKIRDEYTRKSGVSPVRIRNRGKESRESEEETKETSKKNAAIKTSENDSSTDKGFMDDCGKILDAWEKERKKHGLAFVRSDFSTKQGARELAKLAGSGELTLAQISEAMKNLLADPQRQQLWTLSGLARNISSWIGKGEKTVQHNQTVHVDFVEGRCGGCGKDSISIPGGKKHEATCRYCGTQFSVR